MTVHFYSAIAARIFATISALICGVVSLRLYGQYLPPERYGVILVAMQILGYLPLLSGGYRTASNRCILATTEEEERRRLVRFVQTLYTYVGLMVLGGACLLMAGYAATPIARHLGEPFSFFLLLGLAGAVVFFNSSQTTLLLGLKSQAHLFLLSGITSWINVAAMWVVLHRGGDVWAFPISNLISAGATLPMAVVLIRYRSPGFKLFNLTVTEESFWRYHREMKAEAWSCLRSQLATMWLFTVDVVLVGLLCGPKDAAVYGVLTRLFTIVRALLQSACEAAWPVIAEKGKGNLIFTGMIFRTNAWLYGAVLGAMVATLEPFLAWFMGNEWLASATLLYVMVGRSLIVGLASPASYFLMGLGRFDLLARYTERELTVAGILAVGLGWKFRLMGIAVAFLVATVAGSLYAILRAYAQAEGISTWGLLARIWWRGILAGLLSYVTAAGLMRWQPSGVQTVLVGGAGAVAALVFGFLMALARTARVERPDSFTGRIGVIFRYF